MGMYAIVTAGYEKQYVGKKNGEYKFEPYDGATRGNGKRYKTLSNAVGVACDIRLAGTYVSVIETFI